MKYKDKKSPSWTPLWHIEWSHIKQSMTVEYNKDEANNSKNSRNPNNAQAYSENGLQSTDWQKDRQRDYTLILARGSVLARLHSHWVGSRSLPLPRPHWLGWWGLRWEGSLPQGSHCILCFLQTYNNAQSKIHVGSNNPQYPTGHQHKHTFVPFSWIRYYTPSYLCVHAVFFLMLFIM